MELMEGALSPGLRQRGAHRSLLALIQQDVAALRMAQEMMESQPITRSQVLSLVFSSSGQPSNNSVNMQSFVVSSYNEKVEHLPLTSKIIIKKFASKLC